MSGRATSIPPEGNQCVYIEQAVWALGSWWCPGFVKRLHLKNSCPFEIHYLHDSTGRMCRIEHVSPYVPPSAARSAEEYAAQGPEALRVEVKGKVRDSAQRV